MGKHSRGEGATGTAKQATDADTVSQSLTKHDGAHRAGDTAAQMERNRENNQAYRSGDGSTTDK